MGSSVSWADIEAVAEAMRGAGCSLPLCVAMSPENGEALGAIDGEMYLLEKSGILIVAVVNGFVPTAGGPWVVEAVDCD